MSKTSRCADGDHNACPGSVSKWYAESGDTVLFSPTIASDGLGVEVACRCACHASAASVETERAVAVREWVA